MIGKHRKSKLSEWLTVFDRRGRDAPAGIPGAPMTEETGEWAFDGLRAGPLDDDAPAAAPEEVAAARDR